MTEDKGYRDNIYELFKLYLPRTIAGKIRKESDRTGIPMSRLICIAVDNEVSNERAFYYPTEKPGSVYIENAYAAEASKVFDFMKYFKRGTGVDTLMLHRREMDIETPVTLMLAVRELLEQQMLFEIEPPRGSQYKAVKGYKYLMPLSKTEGEKKDRLREQYRREMEELRQKLEDL